MIHTVGPVYSGDQSDEKLLSDCYWNSLELAKKNEIHSIAFPAISTGVYGYPLEEAVLVALHTIARWLDANADYQLAVVLSCFDKAAYDMYQTFNAVIWR